jgi:hypothetical protein
MRVAVLADIHGNLPALEAVLRDVQAAGVDAIVLNGTLPMARCPPRPLTGWRNLATGRSGYGATATARRGVRRHLPAQRPAHEPARRLLRLVRGQNQPRTPGPARQPATDRHPRHRRARAGDLLPRHRTRRQRVHQRGQPDLPLPDRVRGRPRADRGHRAHPHAFDRLADTRRIINPGSVGLPYGHPGAAWALLGPDVVLRRTAYDNRCGRRGTVVRCQRPAGHRVHHRQHPGQRQRRRSTGRLQPDHRAPGPAALTPSAPCQTEQHHD